MAEINHEAGFDERAIRRGSGCGGAVVLVLGAAWAVLGSALAQFITWTLEQVLFEGSLPVKDVRWLVALVYGLAMFLPFFIVSRLTHNTPRDRQIFRTWWLAAIPALLLAPARLLDITASQATALFQVLALLIFLLGLWLWLRGRGVAVNRSGLGAWIALGAGGALAFPWVLWGALGSPLDTLLAALVGLLFGAVAGLLLAYSLLEYPAAESRNLWTDGLIAVVALIILITGVFQNGIEWVMALSVPVLGWAVVALSAAGRGVTGKQTWRAPALLVALGAAWPLMFIDPDELSLVISGGAGELISWAGRAGWVTLALGAVAGLALLVLSKRLQSVDRAGAPAVIAAGVIWAAGIFTYFLAGQPGFYGERLFIILKDQGNTTAAVSMTDYNARRTYVYRTLTEHARQTQSGLRGALDRLHIDYTPYYLVNAIEVTGGPLLRLWAERQPEVDRVLNNPILRPLPETPPTAGGSAAAPQQPDWNLTLIHAPQAWAKGVTGKGIVVGQSDSGVQGDHPELADSYRGRETGSSDYNWFDPWYHTSQPQDIGGHGTHTLGTVLGNSVGVAPDATWIGCVNLARNLGNPALYLDCMQFMLAPFPLGGDPFTDGNADLGAQVLNNSWGCPVVEGCDAETFLAAVAALRDAGIFTVVSAGNSGYSGCGSLKDPPAIYASVYSVGAIGADGQLAPFSSLGPVTVDKSERIKPDIVAPGVDVLSSYPNNTYYVASGTSMAGPHVAGVVALLWSANPALVGDIQGTIEILDASAQPYRGNYPLCVTDTGAPNPAVGYGVVDAAAAVERALGR